MPRQAAGGTGPTLGSACSGCPARMGRRPGCTCATSGPSTQRSRAATSTTSRLSHPVSSRLAAGLHQTLPCYTFYYSIRNAKALCRLGEGLDLRKLVAGAGFEPATSEYEQAGPHPRRVAASMLSSVCAAPGVAVSHRVSGVAAYPRRLYYRRYYPEEMVPHTTLGVDTVADPMVTTSRRRERTCRRDLDLQG